jgi:hypothetical protein
LSGTLAAEHAPGRPETAESGSSRFRRPTHRMFNPRLRDPILDAVHRRLSEKIKIKPDYHFRFDFLM